MTRNTATSRAQHVLKGLLGQRLGDHAVTLGGGVWRVSHLNALGTTAPIDIQGVALLRHHEDEGSSMDLLACAVL